MTRLGRLAGHDERTPAEILETLLDMATRPDDDGSRADQRGELRKAMRQGDYDGERDQDWLAARRSA